MTAAAPPPGGAAVCANCALSIDGARRSHLGCGRHGGDRRRSDHGRDRGRSRHRLAAVANTPLYRVNRHRIERPRHRAVLARAIEARHIAATVGLAIDCDDRCVLHMAIPRVKGRKALTLIPCAVEHALHGDGGDRQRGRGRRGHAVTMRRPPLETNRLTELERSCYVMRTCSSPTGNVERFYCGRALLRRRVAVTPAPARDSRPAMHRLSARRSSRPSRAAGMRARDRDSRCACDGCA